MKIKLLLMLCMLSACLLTGCGAKTSEPITNDEVSISAETNENSDSAESKDAIEEKNTIEKEMESMEEEAEKIYDSMPESPSQLDMNMTSRAVYDFWDAELNSLWGRLKEVLNDDEMEALKQEQLDWIARKEANMNAASWFSQGGSMAPLLETEAGVDTTKKRCYELAEILAAAIGESYSTPDDIKNSLLRVDPSLDEVFVFFEGDHSENGFSVMRFEDSGLDSSNYETTPSWVVLSTNGHLLTDNNVTAYTRGMVVFEKNGYFYTLSEGWEGNEIFLYYGTNILEMHPILDE